MNFSVPQPFPEETIVTILVPPNKYCFYGNSCRLCFIDTPLKTCSGCKTVKYCSVLHQEQDWPEHKRICKGVKKAKLKFPIKKNCSIEEFINNKDKQAAYLQKYLGEDSLKDELEICLLPWVCSVCYDDDVKFKCDNCSVVGYCSLEHKKEDEPEHMSNCLDLKYAKIMDSRYYCANKFIFERFCNNSIVFPENISKFPSDMMALREYLQPQKLFDEVTDNTVHKIIFSDQYSIYATIINILERMKIIWCRSNKKKPHVNQLNRSLFFAANQIIPVPNGMFKDNTMIIHFLASEYYEAQHNWKILIKNLLLWIRNVLFVEITLIGESLIDQRKPNLQKFSVVSNLQFYPFKYKTIYDQLVRPDLMVLLNYGSGSKKNIFNDRVSQESLFYHKNVPLIITSVKEEILCRFVDELKQIDGVNTIIDIHKNPFAEGSPRRIWDQKHMTTYNYNKYICVLSKE